MNLKRKFFTVLAVVALGLMNLNAQTFSLKDLKYRAEAGLTLSKIMKLVPGSVLVGGRLSGQAVLPFECYGLEVASGLTLTNKGESFKAYKDKDYSQMVGSLSSTAFMYLQVPVEVAYSYEIISKHKVSVGTGPYLGFNLTTKDAFFNVFEFGWAGNLRYTYDNTYYVKGGMELGLNGLSDIRTKEGTPRNALMYLTFGYQF